VIDTQPCLLAYLKAGLKLSDSCIAARVLSSAVPRTHNRFGDKSFAVAGPRLWNSLPISLRQISSYGQFRRYLKIIYLGFEKSQRSVTHDSLRYINILTYLLTQQNVDDDCACRVMAVVNFFEEKIG